MENEPTKCFCKYAIYCALTRQRLQIEFRIEEYYQGIYNCEFFKAISENCESLTWRR